MKDWFTNFIYDAKVATGTAGATIGTGLGTALDWIPNDIGKVATLVGIVLSLVLIWNHWRKGRNEEKKNRLEIELLLLQLERERRQDAPDPVNPTDHPSNQTLN